MKEKDYKKQLQKKNLDSTLFEDTGLTDEDIEEMRLPANYFVLNPLREDTAESTIEAFVRSIQKEDMGRALAYCMDESPEELEHYDAASSSRTGRNRGDGKAILLWIFRR